MGDLTPHVAPADVALVTALSLEHTEVLGDTLEDIAGEKAAIARTRTARARSKREAGRCKTAHHAMRRRSRFRGR